MAGVDIRQVRKSFGRVDVIHGIDITVKDGEFVVLVGPSGCGKSTLLRMIAGLEGVSDGEIAIGGRVVNDLPPRSRDIAMVFQDYALYPHKTVAENIAFGLRMRGASKPDIEKLVGEAADILQIRHLLERKPGQLSGGQRQRVAMGRAIVRRPLVFLFDEPLSNLDAQLRAEMRIEIKKLHQRFGTTIVYVTHDQIEAMTLADRIAILKGGHLQQFDTPDACYARPSNRFVAGFIGSPPMNFATVDIAADASSVTLGAGASAAVPQAARPRFDAAAGRRAVMGLRPEHVRPASGGEAATAHGAVELVEPLGAETLVLLRVGDAALTGRFPPEAKLRPGDRVPLSLALEHAHVFEEETGRALARAA
ncbi:sn-glycerol-3-phosphate ABC transporter ATP-binding protein UgpC [Alsobacter sp. SYSU M60028]|uniref:Sn-glycerol-3-phosphate ABC transporter ATP-binding protein UgpC n=1 Tax=Alsobacter ponti TaxID=2962936 RepID=A0ABT1L882_9HYPH|nr:sn-glycerol-3-phosphate ABC transporter ATP-binding protein UgpC [Alsobacter ponti]